MTKSSGWIFFCVCSPFDDVMGDDVGGDTGGVPI